MKKLLLLLSLAPFGIAGCGHSGGSSSGYSLPTNNGNPAAPPNAVAPPTTSAAVPLSLNIFTVYDTTTFADNQNFIETNSTTCEATTSNPVVTCTLQIPEGRLFYSSMTFQYSWFTSSCKLFTFQPYFYRASQSGGYVPPGSPPGSVGIDCSGVGSQPSAVCWGGAAPAIVPAFPLNVGLIYLPDESLSVGIAQHGFAKLPSSYLLHVGDPVDPTSIYQGSNRLTVNDMKPANYGNNYTSAQLGGIGDGYIHNTYVNYTFECRDDWYDPQTYVIHLNIEDVNTNNQPPGSGLDNMVTWDELP